MTLEQAFNVVVQVCNAHLCNAADRDAINQALNALNAVIVEPEDA